MSIELNRALRAFDADAFVAKHGGRKESNNPQSREYLLTCPLCHGSNLRWNTARAEGVGGWVCWGCNTSGNTLYLVQLFERIDLFEAIQYVLGEYQGGDATLELKDIAAMPAPSVSMPKLEKLPRMPPPPYLVDAREHPKARAYLHGRGIDDAMIASWGIRAGTKHRLTDYAVFPVVMDGGLVYYQARACWDPPKHLTDDQRRAWIKATHYRKTLNPTNPAMASVRQATAGEVLFNYDRAKSFGHVVIVEGPIDAVKVGPHAVALLGKGTDEKIARLKRMGARKYTVYLDRGEDEQKKAEKIAAALAGWAEVYITLPPPRMDAGDLTPEQNAAVVAHGRPATENRLKSALIP